MTYKVLIEERVSETFEIEADNIDEAREMVIKGYQNCEIVLEPGNLISAEFSIYGKDDELITRPESIY